jgi:hypothetical protein
VGGGEGDGRLCKSGGGVAIGRPGESAAAEERRACGAGGDDPVDRKPFLSWFRGARVGVGERRMDVGVSSDVVTSDITRHAEPDDNLSSQSEENRISQLKEPSKSTN